MIGTLVGDFMGSTYEGFMMKGGTLKEVPQFYEASDLPDNCKLTDDSVVVFAEVESFLTGKPVHVTMKEWVAHYPDAGYGKMFFEWVQSPRLYNSSFGNGAACRAALLGKLYSDEKVLLKKVKQAVSVTHRTHTAIQTGEAAALMAFGKNGMEVLKEYFPALFTNGEPKPIKQLSDQGYFNCTAAATIPQALLVAASFKDPYEAMNHGIWLNQDPDTQAAIVGQVMNQAEIMKGSIAEKVINSLDKKMSHWFNRYSSEIGFKS